MSVPLHQKSVELRWSLDEIAQLVDGQLVTHSHHASDQKSVAAVTIDSRQISKHALFVAIKGPRFDGHDFVESAIAKGATCALVEKIVPDQCSQIIVSSTEIALRKLATAWRFAVRAKIIGITGSNGKTTIKEWLSKGLEQAGFRVTKTTGNLNNHLGLPLSILSMPHDTEYGVFETGISNPGEMEILANTLQPDCAILTSIAPAHIEGFGSEAVIASEKSILLSAVRPGGFAIYPSDSAYRATFERAIPKTVKALGVFCTDSSPEQLDKQADYGTVIHAQTVSGSSFDCYVDAEKKSLKVDWQGSHQIWNAGLIATAIFQLTQQKKMALNAIQTLPNVGQRLVRHDLKIAKSKTETVSVQLIDDTYNANLSSVQAALQLLSLQPSPRVVVLGALAELGDAATSVYQALATSLCSMDLTQIVLCGENLSILNASIESSSSEAIVELVADHESAANVVLDSLQDHATILVKGSRSATMEKVVELIQEKA